MTPDAVHRHAWRVVRAWAMAGLVVWVSALGHFAGGGSLPGWPVLVLASVLAFPPAALLTTHRVTTAAATAYLGLGQFLLHLGFSLTDSSSGGPSGAVVDTVVDTAAGHCAPTVVMLPAAAGGTDHGLHQHGLDLRMSLAHLVAALILGKIVAHADAVAWLVVHLLSTLAAWLRPHLRPAPLLARPRRSTVTARLRRPRPLFRLTTTSSRGPPIRVVLESSFVS